jgi:hypothetical protein
MPSNVMTVGGPLLIDGWTELRWFELRESGPAAGPLVASIDCRGQPA